MSYYLGKVGRAGARLVSSCKDLYYDVNAAYLTGAVDIIVVRQQDGSLKSTPFHVRFGKLGVLRTGDQKEVEIEINNCAVDLRMWIDESGRAFFVKKKATEDGNEGSSPKREQSAAIDIPNQCSKDTVEDTLRSRSSTQDSKSTDSTPKDAPRDVPSKPSDDEGTPPRPLPLSEVSLFERRYSEPVDVIGAGAVGRDGPLSEQQGRGEGKEEEEGIIWNKSDHQLVTSSLPNSSVAIQIEEIGELGYDFGPQSVLPDDYEVFSDSAVERERDYEGASARGVSALSDTEVEVKDRLSSKLWDWSASHKRPTHASKGESCSQMLTELTDDEVKHRLQPQPAAAVDRSGFWGALTGILKRRRQQRLSTTEDGIYLEDIDSDSMDPEELSQFFPSSHPLESTTGVDQANSSGIGSSPVLSPSQSNYDVRKEGLHKLVSTLDDVAFSLCGGLGGGSISEEAFQNSLVTFDEFCRDPSGLFTNPKLVVRVEGKYYSWQVAAPMIMSAIVFLQVLPMDTQKKLVNKLMPKKSRGSFWSFWGRGQQQSGGEDQEKAKSEGATPVGSPRKWMVGDEKEREGAGHSRNNLDDIPSSDDDQTTSTKVNVRPRQRSFKRRAKQEFTNELTPDQLENLPLQHGTNKVVFSITTKYQGTARAECTLYYWNYYDKIVVSDVDGTITRSDVAGHVLPFLGRDWTQNGVVELFNSVEKNGYKIVYLSARAIGQAGYTKDFLRNIRRGKVSLPDGPLLLAPFSLYIAFRREVIEKRPEDFKIECLRQIKAIFPEDHNPFHAGFGNKHSDVKSYLNVGIPESRIFTVNHKGLVKYELSRTFQSSYSHLMEFADRQFPPLHLNRFKSSQDFCPIKEEFTTFNYWRQPTATVELPADV